MSAAGCHCFDSAKEVLDNNNNPVKLFSSAVKELLTQGRGKYRNVMIVGPANCAKTFVLLLLTSIFQCFLNPASTMFVWVAAEEADVILLNGLRWSAQLIPWHDFLLLLEGQAVHLPAPKSYFAKDVLLTGDNPIFCTTSHELCHINYGVVNEIETEMMSVRWRVFQFHLKSLNQNKRIFVQVKGVLQN